MATYASPEDVARSLRGSTTVSSAEDVQWQEWLDRVESRIRRRIPDLDDLASDQDYLETVKGVEVEVVIRKIQNPDGMKSERIDDYYYDRGTGGPSNLWLTDDEWRELGWVASTEAFSTRPGFEPDVPARPLPWGAELWR